MGDTFERDDPDYIDPCKTDGSLCGGYGVYDPIDCRLGFTICRYYYPVRTYELTATSSATVGGYT
jgi:hypothetical protein